MHKTRQMIFHAAADKETIFNHTEDYIIKKNLHISSRDTQRPWGGFLVIDEKDAAHFVATFFPGYTTAMLSAEMVEGKPAGKLSPKILIVAPDKRLSWQYHHRRAEIWTLIGGEAAVITSHTDEENETVTLQKGKNIELAQGERHRLIGLQNWGIVAEIWRHTDANHPSDEEDIVRLQDDFGRGKL